MTCSPTRRSVAIALLAMPGAVARADAGRRTARRSRRRRGRCGHHRTLDRRSRRHGRAARDPLAGPALEMVNAGIVELTAVDEHKAQLWVRIFPEVLMLESVSWRDEEQIARAMRPDSPPLKEAVDAFVKAAAKGTKLGNMLIKKNLGTTRWIANAAAEQDRARFLQMVALFRLYADQYGFDDPMVGAQAYQESRLQQDLKSPVGAIGVMQVMPATANDPNIAIPDIRELESNIHAAIKPVRFILDEDVADARFDDFNRMMFAFATYNAGPNKIARLR